jgi:excisionase family DNA binding protein
MASEYVKPRAIADELAVSRFTVYKWIREGKLPSVHFGKSVRVPRDAYEAFKRAAEKPA